MFIILEINSATQANRLIIEGLILYFELKAAELYESFDRIHQYFNCQQYTEYISLYYKNKIKYDYCGDKHITNECLTKKHTIHRIYAVYKQSNYLF
jgi:hypothetical protein